MKQCFQLYQVMLQQIVLLNFPNNLANAFNLSFTQFLPELFLSFFLGSCITRTPTGYRFNYEINNIKPNAVSIDTIVIPCSLNRVLILSPNFVSLSKNFLIDSFIWVIWLENLSLSIGYFFISCI